MEHLAFILIIVVAALVYIAYFWTERSLYEERTRSAILREREDIAFRMLFDLWERLHSSDNIYTSKDEVMRTLVAAMNVVGHLIEPHKPHPADPDPEESSADGDTGGR